MLNLSISTHPLADNSDSIFVKKNHEKSLACFENKLFKFRIKNTPFFKCLFSTIKILNFFFYNPWLYFQILKVGSHMRRLHSGMPNLTESFKTLNHNSLDRGVRIPACQICFRLEAANKVNTLVSRESATCKSQ